VTDFRTAGELLAAVGADLDVGPWVSINQSRIDGFADVTGDHAWIHTDPARAAAGPFGTTIAHGFLTLSMLGTLLPPVFSVSGAVMGVNYGVDRVRFPAPVPSGSRLRARGRLTRVTRTADNAVQTVLAVAVERADFYKPVCVAEMVGRFYFG
jgi:acyl dehydratase